MKGAIVETVEMTPTGTTNTAEDAVASSRKIPSEPSGPNVIREPKDLFKNWELAAGLPTETFTVSDTSNLPSVENRVLFGIVRDPEIQIVSAIPVEISHEGTTVVASWAAVDEFGHGANFAEALEDLGRSVTGLFKALSRDENSLGIDLQQVLKTLRSHLRFRPR